MTKDEARLIGELYHTVVDLLDGIKGRVPNPYFQETQKDALQLVEESRDIINDALDLAFPISGN